METGDLYCQIESGICEFIF